MPEIAEPQNIDSLSPSEAEKEGDRLFAENQHEKALDHFYHALKVYEKSGKRKETAGIYFKIGNLYSSIQYTEKALSSLMEGLTIVNLLKDEREITRFQIKIGHFFQDLYQFSNAYEYYTNALKTAKKLNDVSLIQECHFLIGNCLNWLDRYDDAYEQLNIALSLGDENVINKKKIVGSIGILLYKMKEFEKSLEYLTTALTINKNTDNDISFKASILKSMGYVYFVLNNLPEAFASLKEALSIAEKLKQSSTMSVIHEHYSTIYESIGDYKNALDHLNKHKEHSDMLLDEHIKLTTRELQKKFDIAESQREKEIYRLKNVDLANANEKILKQKIELEDKNRNITDSIFYAGRLQKAILPPENVLNKYFAEAFILFQPKDIVSGDFYWFSGVNDRFILAAVDCTGHGVPGALMSMMGNNFLSSIVETEGKTNPAEILQEMNNRTKASLQNKDASVTANDGMDLALCSIDFKQQVLHFAGAYRPLVYIRNGQLIEIKGDKRSIGGFSDVNTAFALHEIQIEKGDTFYLFSDGYADQFGGEKGRKYMTGKLKDFLCTIASKEMKEQHQLLIDNHIAWRGDNQQVDDLLIIGFRF